MSQVAVLGLGAMGSRMAINLAKAGHDVTVWNRTTERAVDLAAAHDMSVATTPSAAALEADIVVSMVADDDAARSVWLHAETGALSSMGNDAIAIESSTLTPDAVRELATAANARGLAFIEAPVVGSRPQAEAGALFTLLGGDAAVIERAQTIIDVNAGNSKRVGEVGDAAVMKLAINGLFAAQVAAYAEVAGFLEKSPLDTAGAMATLAALPLTSPGLQRIVGLIAERQYEPNFPVHLVAKDLAYLAATGDAASAELPMMATAGEVFARGATGPLGALDISGIASLYQASDD